RREPRGERRRRSPLRVYLAFTRRGGRARLKASDSKSDRGVSPSGVQILSPPPFFQAQQEGWPSGRRCGTGNAVYGQLYRGFESPPLRHILIEKSSDANCPAKAWPC